MKKVLLVLLVVLVGGGLVAGDVYAGTAGGGAWTEPSPDYALEGAPVGGLTRSDVQTGEIMRVGPHFGDRIGLTEASYAGEEYKDSLGGLYYRGFGTFEGMDLSRWAFTQDSLAYFYKEYANEYEIYGEAQQLGLEFKPTYTEAEIRRAIEMARDSLLLGSSDPCMQKVSGSVAPIREGKYYVGLPDGQTGVVKRNVDSSWSFYFPLKEGARSRLILEYEMSGKMKGFFRTFDSEVNSETRGALDYIINQGFPSFNELMRRYKGVSGECGPWGEPESLRGRDVSGSNFNAAYSPSGEFRIVPPGSFAGAAGPNSAPEFQVAPAASTCGRRDVNGDGKINIVDLVLVARRFGQRNPIQRIAGNTVPWSPEDVKNDDVINIIDLVTVAQRFGDQCGLTTGYVPAGERVVFVPVPVTKQPQNTGFASVLKSIFWVIGN